MSKAVFAEGIRTFKKNEKAPDFVLGSVVISLNEFFSWCKKNENLMTDYKGVKQLKLQCLKSRDGGINFQVDTWKPEQKNEPEIVETIADEINDLPF